MGVVRIDDKLLNEIKKVLSKEENRYKYSSISAYLNSVIYEKLQGGKK